MPPIAIPFLPALLLAPPLLHDPPARAPEDPLPTARKGEVAVLRFSIAEEGGGPIAGRLTFLDAKGEEPALFVDSDPASGLLAVRKNVVYALGKPVSITVPPGRYTVHATRGIEWSRATAEISLEAGKAAEWHPRLVHEVDTPGWVSGDFHLHTLTYSGHGDSNLNERLISLLGEGVEFAVATDHNHHTDYGPTVRALGAEGEISTVTGNEISTPIGHFNAFPLDPTRPPVDSKATDAGDLFRRIRLEPNVSGATPLVQVNHPRYAEIDYFGLKGLDPVTGEAAGPGFSLAFDSVEVFNANATWGFEGIDPDDRRRGTNLHSVLHDWYRLLDRGERIAAVGNSDSHTVHYDMAGFPRNYVRLEAAGPGAIDPKGIAEAVKAKAAFTTTGPFVRFEVEGAPMGSSVVARSRPDGSRFVGVSIAVRSASWIPFDRVYLVQDGEIVRTSKATDPHRFEAAFEKTLDEDAWACVLVEGAGSLWPIVGERENPTRPLALTNPIWIDADGDGRFTPPWERAKALAAAPEGAPFRAAWDASNGWARCRLLLAALEAAPARARELVPEALAHRERTLRLAAARAAERLGDAALRGALRSAAATAGADAYLAIALARARARCGEDRNALLVELLERFPVPEPVSWKREVGPLFGEAYVAEWKAIGYFPAAERALVKREFGPEADADPAKAWPGKGGVEARWVDVKASADGFVSLGGLAGDGPAPEGAIAYAQAWLHSPEDRKVGCALGADDGCRVWVGGVLLYENAARKRAHPAERFALLRLKAGWNRVLFKVENRSGPTGLYFRVFDPAVRAAPVPASGWPSER